VTAIRPFRALRYDPGRVDLGRVLVPPYDVISPEERERFRTGDPHSAVRLELAGEESESGYRKVAETLAAWRRSGVLVRDRRPALYGLRQRFAIPGAGPGAGVGAGGQEAVREGFFAELHLEDYDQRVVLPHERTLAGPKRDRLRMLRATRANLSVIFLLYEDREGQVAEALSQAFAGPALARATDPAGVEETLVAVDDAAAIARVQALLAERPVVIADGHHRYETALAYRDERRDERRDQHRDERRDEEPGEGGDPAAEWTLAYFANAHAPGTLILPIHRVIAKGSAPAARAWRETLPGWECREVPLAGPDAVPAALAEHLEPLAHRHAFAADDGSGTLRILSRARRPADPLPVRAIHDEVIGGLFGLDAEAVRGGAVVFRKDAVQAARDVREGRGAVALYLNALTPEDVFRTTAAGELLPQKSTLFHPKLPTGLVFRMLDGDGAAGDASGRR